MTRSDGPETDWVGLPTAAEVLGVHRATVNDMVLSRKLPARRRRGHWYVARQDLDRFAATYVRPPNAPPTRDHGPSEAGRQILELLKDYDSASVAELDRLMDLHEGNIRKQLRLLEMDGLVRRDGDGQWKLLKLDNAEPNGVLTGV